MTLAFFVPGVPRATQTGSVIRVRGRAFPLRRNTQWAEVFGIYARESAPPTPMAGALSVSMQFVMPRPKAKRALPIVRPDIDGLAKGLLDKGNGFLWKNDSQICWLTLSKSYTADGEHPGVHITVKEMP